MESTQNTNELPEVKKFRENGLKIHINPDARIVCFRQRQHYFLEYAVMAYSFKVNGKWWFQPLVLNCRCSRFDLAPYARKLYEAAKAAGIVHDYESYESLAN